MFVSNSLFHYSCINQFDICFHGDFYQHNSLDIQEQVNCKVQKTIEYSNCNKANCRHHIDVGLNAGTKYFLIDMYNNKAGRFGQDVVAGEIRPPLVAGLFHWYSPNK